MDDQASTSSGNGQLRGVLTNVAVSLASSLVVLRW
jgi:hypothetical protein